MNKKLREFKEGKFFAMVLDFYRFAAGANMPQACHVIFANPDSAEREEQAVGRVRRLGQRAEKVMVWRFVANSQQRGTPLRKYFMPGCIGRGTSCGTSTGAPYGPIAW